MGYIYKIDCIPTGKSYVGQTTIGPNYRLQKHYKDSRNALKYNYRTQGSFRGGCTELYKAMNQYLITDFKVEQLIECDDSKLDENEIKYVAHYNTLYPNGYNLTAGGKSKHTDRTKKLISKRTSEGITNNNIDSFRKHAILRGMPKHIIYKKRSETNYGFAISKHPLCKFKSFTTARYGNIEECRIKVLEYLEQLNKQL